MADRFHRLLQRLAGLGRTALLVVLNGRYAVDGAAPAIAFFNGIYDMQHNAGVLDAAGAIKPAALAACPGNECSV